MRTIEDRENLALVLLGMGGCLLDFPRIIRVVHDEYSRAEADIVTDGCDCEDVRELVKHVARNVAVVPVENGSGYSTVGRSGMLGPKLTHALAENQGSNCGLYCEGLVA